MDNNPVEGKLHIIRQSRLSRQSDIYVGRHASLAATRAARDAAKEAAEANTDEAAMISTVVDNNETIIGTIGKHRATIIEVRQ